MPGGEVHGPTDTVIWRQELVTTMIAMLGEAIERRVPGPVWGIAPEHQFRLQDELMLLLERSRDGYVIADVPMGVIDDLRMLRLEVYQRLRSERGQ